LDPATPQQRPVLGSQDKLVEFWAGNEPQLGVNFVSRVEPLLRHVVDGFIARDEPHLALLDWRESSDAEGIHAARLVSSSFPQLPVGIQYVLLRPAKPRVSRPLRASRCKNSLRQAWLASRYRPRNANPKWGEPPFCPVSRTYPKSELSTTSG
jgi:hypothetical protein